MPTTRPTAAEIEAATAAPVTADTLRTAQVVREARPPTVVFACRLDSAYSDDIAAEAERCGQRPSQLIADLVIEGLRRRQGAARTVTVNLDDLHRAIDAAATAA